MSKKKGLGDKVNKSLEKMKDLMSALKTFSEIPLKEGLPMNLEPKDKEGIHKEINEAIVQATELYTKVEDLTHKIRGIKANRSSRFASQVVQRFLERQY
jgi:hypothetical protein